MLFYRAALPLSHQTLTLVSDLIRAHRRQLGSSWRKLNAGQQALLVLVYLRKGEPFAEVGAGFAVSTTTCWRYVNETVELLAVRAPKLRQALREAKHTGMAYVIIDGTLIPIDRIAADRPFYSGKHKMHGMNLQVIASPDGAILWVSGQLPGSTHETAAARIWNILAALREANLIALGDKGYHGYDHTGEHVITPYKGRGKPQSQKDANRAHARLRGPGERAHAQLKSWRVLRKLRCCPRRAGRLAKAIHVLQNYEVTVG
ncbi:MAG: transposase family protein [Labedaea sp.]